MLVILIIVIVVILVRLVIFILRAVKNDSTYEPKFSNMPKINMPIKNHYYVIVYNSQRVIAQYLHQACWNLNFRIVDDSYIDQVDGELICTKYSIVIVH